jgi:U3 small nucleolar RNA-associated protein 20
VKLFGKRQQNLKMGPKVLKTHQKKVRKAGEEKKPKRFVHKSFNKQVADISVSVSHFTELGHDVGKDGDLQQSHLQEAIQEWRGINRCEAFGAFCFKLRPLCRTMPMIIFNLDKIVPIVLDNLKDADSLGLEPVLGVLAALSRDARHELTPYFHDIFNVLVDLLETCLQNAPVLEKIFQCFSFLFKYLVKYITKDLEPYAEAYGRLFSHHKHYIRQFAGESFAFLLRRSDAKRAVELLLRQLDRCDPAKEDYLADSVAVVITEASKSIQNGFHSKLEDFFNVLLSTKNIAKSVARRRVVKSAFLRLRNHADELEFCAPLLEIWLKQNLVIYIFSF